MNVKKEARRDAREYARAQMFYGEGAGTRRKLIGATVDGKSARNREYGREFARAYAREDMAEHAAKAHSERVRKDGTNAVTRNVKGLATGNYQSVNGAVIIVIAGAVLVHKTGLDLVIARKVKSAKKQWERRRDYKKRGFTVVS